MNVTLALVETTKEAVKNEKAGWIFVFILLAILFWFLINKSLDWMDLRDGRDSGQ